MTNVAEIRNRLQIEPIYLIEITLLNGGGNIYFSDRNITYNSINYEDYISSITGLKQDVERLTSRGNNSEITITFKNDKFRNYSYLIELDDIYPLQGADITIKKVYLDTNDILTNDYETVFVGILQEPNNINLMSFNVTVSSKEFVQELINRRK